MKGSKLHEDSSLAMLSSAASATVETLAASLMKVETADLKTVHLASTSLVPVLASHSREVNAIAATLADSAMVMRSEVLLAVVEEPVLASLSSVVSVIVVMLAVTVTEALVVLGTTLPSLTLDERLATECALPSRRASVIVDLPAASAMEVTPAPSPLPSPEVHASSSREESATVATLAASVMRPLKLKFLVTVWELFEFGAVSRYIEKLL